MNARFTDHTGGGFGQPPGGRRARSSRLVVVGIDSGDPELIEEWAGAGHLPTFRRLLQTSAHGRVINPVGLEAGSAWPTFYNGLNPAGHGQYDGTRRFDSTTYRDTKYGSEMLHPEPIWNVLSDAGKRVALIDAPYRYLSGKLHGIEVHDWGTHAPTGKNSFAVFGTHPTGLADEIGELFGSDPLGGAMCDAHRPRTLEELRDFRDKLVLRAAAKGAMSEHFLAREDWDFYLTCFSECHCIGHHAWHIHDVEHPEHDPAIAGQLGDPMLAVYRAVDSALGSFFRTVADDAIVVVYCSHGMGQRFSGTHLLDKILLRLEGIECRDTPGPVTSLMRGLWRRLPSPMRLALKPAQAKAYKKIYRDGFGGNRHKRRCFEILANDRTAGIRINLAGRESQGRVLPGKEYDSLCSELERKLMRIINLDTGERLVDEVHRTAGCHKGPRQHDLPDLLVTWNRVGSLRRIGSPDIGEMQHVELSYRTGDHKPDGRFFAYGPGIARGPAPAVEAVDFAPTFASLLGAPMPATDGVPIPLFFSREDRRQPQPAEDNGA